MTDNFSVDVLFLVHHEVNKLFYDLIGRLFMAQK